MATAAVFGGVDTPQRPTTDTAPGLLRELITRLIREWVEARSGNYGLPAPYLRMEADWLKAHADTLLRLVQNTDELDEAVMEREEMQERVWTLEMALDEALAADTLEKAHEALRQVVR
jgi:hypothetical protein